MPVGVRVRMQYRELPCNCRKPTRHVSASAQERRGSTRRVSTAAVVAEVLGEPTLPHRVDVGDCRRQRVTPDLTVLRGRLDQSHDPEVGAFKMGITAKLLADKDPTRVLELLQPLVQPIVTDV